MSKVFEKMESSLEEVIAFRKHMFETSMALIKQKGADYNRDQQESGDTLFNLRVCELLGIVDTTEQGILVRLSDKFMRLISLTKEPGREPEVTDEKVRDTARDVHNYLDYLVLIYEKRRAALLLEQDAPTGITRITPQEAIGFAKIPDEVITQTVTCLGCLGEQHVHSYDERCQVHLEREAKEASGG